MCCCWVCLLVVAVYHGDPLRRYESVSEMGKRVEGKGALFPLLFYHLLVGTPAEEEECCDDEEAADESCK